MPYRFACLNTISKEDGAVFAKANFRSHMTFSPRATPLPGRKRSKIPNSSLAAFFLGFVAGVIPPRATAAPSRHDG